MQSSDPSDPSDHPAPGDHLVDWENFESILSYTNASESPEILRRILQTYQTDRDIVLDAVQALDPADHNRARQLLHKLKGSTGSLALMGALETIKLLHDPLEGPSPEQRDELLRRIREDTTLAIQAVRRRYSWLNEDPA